MISRKDPSGGVDRTQAAKFDFTDPSTTRHSQARRLKQSTLCFKTFKARSLPRTPLSATLSRSMASSDSSY
ncbi:uncharacterized protein PAC_10554 [Phialocephala subalpina]|uniref:Uncharacterized protein n=1 Tax=Phialocephala subalpina TaxID=576137 RepID=A0A1L7X6L7_9HELO|nr:uncharacterized protein PAC_10554 [Phialocephala subalpina]